MTLDSNPYSPPSTAHTAAPPGPWNTPTSQGGPVRAHGTDAILTLGTYLPEICVKCGRKEGLVRRNLTLVRHPLWLYGLFALGIWPYFIARLGLAKGTASMCLCRLCLGRYTGAGTAKIVVAIPIFGAILMESGMLGRLPIDAAIGALLVGGFVFAVGAALSWLVMSQFVHPRQLELQERRGFEMRVSGFDQDALAECVAYARYWSSVVAQQQAHTGYGYGPAAAYVAPQYHGVHGPGARPPPTLAGYGSSTSSAIGNGYGHPYGAWSPAVPTATLAATTEPSGAPPVVPSRNEPSPSTSDDAPKAEDTSS